MAAGRKDLAPTAHEFSQLRARLQAMGVRMADLREAVDDTVRGRTRDEIMLMLKRWLRNRPKRAP